MRPKQGEVWLVDFRPTIGAEISKLRPAVVVSLPDVGILPLEMVVPVTDWKEHYAQFSWFTHLVPSRSNGLMKESGADAYQCKSVSLKRFQRKIGVLKAAELNNIIAGVISCISP